MKRPEEMGPNFRKFSWSRLSSDKIFITLVEQLLTLLDGNMLNTPELLATCIYWTYRRHDDAMYKGTWECQSDVGNTLYNYLSTCLCFWITCPILIGCLLIAVFLKYIKLNSYSNAKCLSSFCKRSFVFLCSFKPHIWERDK